MNNLLFKILRQILVNQTTIFEGMYPPVNSTFSQIASYNLIKEIDDSTGANDIKKSEIDWQKGDTAEVKQGWERAGFRFDVLGPAVFLGQWWVPIEDPEDDDPDEPTYHKEAGLRKV